MDKEEVTVERDVAKGLQALGNIGATVSGANPDTEDSVIGQQQWEAIHERRAGGASLSVIAREFDLDRKTVRSCLQQTTWSPYRRETSGQTLLDEHRPWLVVRAPEVNYSARILYQELRHQRGFSGSYETVKLAVRPLRAAGGKSEICEHLREGDPSAALQSLFDNQLAGHACGNVSIRPINFKAFEAIQTVPLDSARLPSVSLAGRTVFLGGVWGQQDFHLLLRPDEVISISRSEFVETLQFIGKTRANS